jgi:tetratricopeptide (TPR) repeat protein
MATRAQHLGRLLDRSAFGMAEILATLADQTLALGGNDAKALAAARRWAQAACSIAPRSRDALLALARSAAQQEDYATADRALRQIIGRHPNDAEALHEMGMLAEERGVTAQARRLFQRGVRCLDPARQPWAALLYLSMAELELAAGNRSTAMRRAREGVRRLHRYRLDVGVLDHFLRRAREPAGG